MNTYMTEAEVWECLADLVLAGIEPLTSNGRPPAGICALMYTMANDGLIPWWMTRTVSQEAVDYAKVNHGWGYIGEWGDWRAKGPRGKYILKMYRKTNPTA